MIFLQKGILHFIFPICLELGFHLLHEKKKVKTQSLYAYLEEKRIFVVALILITFFRYASVNAQHALKFAKFQLSKTSTVGKGWA